MKLIDIITKEHSRVFLVKNTRSSKVVEVEKFHDCVYPRVIKHAKPYSSFTFLENKRRQGQVFRDIDNGCDDSIIVPIILGKLEDLVAWLDGPNEHYYGQLESEKDLSDDIKANEWIRVYGMNYTYSSYTPTVLCYKIFKNSDEMETYGVKIVNGGFIVPIEEMASWFRERFHKAFLNAIKVNTLKIWGKNKKNKRRLKSLKSKHKSFKAMSKTYKHYVGGGCEYYRRLLLDLGLSLNLNPSKYKTYIYFKERSCDE